MKTAPLQTWQVRGAGGPAPYDWADGLRIKAPAGFFEQTGGWLDGSAPARPGYDAGDLAKFQEHAAWTHRPPASGRLPFAYHRVPAWLRIMAARGLGRWQAHRLEDAEAFPQWPLDLSVDFLADLLKPPTTPVGTTPVLVTHDIDSPEGLDNLLRHFAPLEERLGARSVNYIVPCKWPLDHGLLSELVARGHRLGVHGYDHANRTPFCDTDERRRRVAATMPLIERYSIKGYRAPSLCRTPALFDELAKHFVYDSSIPTSGGLFPLPDNGCASARPFRLRGLLELPVSMPRDGSLLFLGHAPDAVLALWKTCAIRLIRSRGLIVLLTHCEKHFCGRDSMLRVYEALLTFLREQAHVAFTTETELLDSLAEAGRQPLPTG